MEKTDVGGLGKMGKTTDRSSKTKKRKRRGIRILIAVLCIILLIAAGGVSYVYTLLGKIKHTPLVHENGTDDEKPKKMTPEDLGVSDELKKYESKGVTNVLLFGLDGRTPGERSRSDSIMIATLDGKNKKIKLTSIMRDTYVSIPERQDNRINAAYAFGGPALAIRTVNENFNMNIEKYVTIDFFGLEKVIDELGGVEIDVKDYEIKHLNGLIQSLNNLNKNQNSSPLIQSPGKQHLNGRQAVAYSRIRKVGNGDFERTDRQRAVLMALVEEGKDVDLWELPGILSAVFPEVETNFTKNEILKYGWTGLESMKNDVEELRLPYEGTYEHQRIREMAVLVPDMEKNREILHDFIYGTGSTTYGGYVED